MQTQQRLFCFPRYTWGTMETQLSQQQSWIWKRRADVQMWKHSSHSKPKHHYASQPKFYGDRKDPLISGKEWHTPKHNWKGRLWFLKCLCNWVQQQICLSHCGKEEHKQGPGRWGKGRSRTQGQELLLSRTGSHFSRDTASSAALPSKLGDEKMQELPCRAITMQPPTDARQW